MNVNEIFVLLVLGVLIFMFADAIISISCKIINNILVRDFKDGQVEVYAPFEMINR